MPTFRNTVSSVFRGGVSRKYIYQNLYADVSENCQFHRFKYDISEFYMATFRNTVSSVFRGGVSGKDIYQNLYADVSEYCQFHWCKYEIYQNFICRRFGTLSIPSSYAVSRKYIRILYADVSGHCQLRLHRRCK